MCANVRILSCSKNDCNHIFRLLFLSWIDSLSVSPFEVVEVFELQRACRIVLVPKVFHTPAQVDSNANEACSDEGADVQCDREEDVRCYWLEEPWEHYVYYRYSNSANEVNEVNSPWSVQGLGCWLNPAIVPFHCTPYVYCSSAKSQDHADICRPRNKRLREPSRQLACNAYSDQNLTNKNPQRLLFLCSHYFWWKDKTGRQVRFEYLGL